MNQGTQNSQVAASPTAGDNTLKDPKNWVTGGEPMTGAQRSYLNTLGECCESIDIF